MTADDLFLATLDDLDARLELGRGEYDALCMAWLLRRLFENGVRSLVSQVNVDPVIELVFTVHEELPVEDVGAWVPIAPSEEAEWNVDLGLDDFLKRTAVVAGWSDRREISVRQLVLWLANNEGAVHLSASREPWEIALATYRDFFKFVTPDGHYTGGVYSLVGIAQVARAGLEPLRASVAARQSI